MTWHARLGPCFFACIQCRCTMYHKSLRKFFIITGECPPCPFRDRIRLQCLGLYFLPPGHFYCINGNFMSNIILQQLFLNEFPCMHQQGASCALSCTDLKCVFNWVHLFLLKTGAGGRVVPSLIRGECPL